MSWMQLERELEIARSVALRAGELALRHQAAGVSAESKDDLSPVTIADRESERLIASALAEAFPADGLLGEEGAQKESRSGRRWIIDPIDGTRDFVRGNPFWAVLIALEAEGEVVAGVANLPGMGRLYSASAGGGAWRNDAHIRVSSIDSADRAVFCLDSINKAHLRPFGGRLVEWIARFWAVRSFGGCLDAMMVAEGQADAWIEISAKPWDFAPIKIIIEEACGRYFNFDGGRSIYSGNCVVCTPALEAHLRDFFVAEASAVR